MQKNKCNRYHRFAAALMLALVVWLCGCSSSDTAEQVTESAPIPAAAAPAEPDTPPTVESYPFAVMLEDGSEIEITLPRDPELWAELHVCAFADETTARVVLYNVADSADSSVEEARAFSGDDGTEYRVVSPAEILDRYMTVSDGADAWTITVGGAEYAISKAQFADQAGALLSVPDASRRQDFFVENGRLYCRVAFSCTEDGTSFAAETLTIRYDLIDGMLTAAEIAFERTEQEDAEEQEETP